MQVHDRCVGFPHTVVQRFRLLPSWNLPRTPPPTPHAIVTSASSASSWQMRGDRAGMGRKTELGRGTHASSAPLTPASPDAGHCPSSMQEELGLERGIWLGSHLQGQLCPKGMEAGVSGKPPPPPSLQKLQDRSTHLSCLRDRQTRPWGVVLIGYIWA